jgi:hypothetical protein
LDENSNRLITTFDEVPPLPIQNGRHGLPRNDTRTELWC